jgi:hypothetical protein
VTFALALGSHGVEVARARMSIPTGEAEWIWKPLARSESSPVGFYAVRDFTLDPPPANARLLISADQEYILYLNGRRLGSGRYASGKRGALLDRYEVADRLAPGGNRLLVEVRSGQGTGGLLLALVDGASGRPLLGTDERWRLFRRDHPFLLRGLVPISPKLELGEGEDIFSWGLPPMGRWGVPTVGPERPLYPDLVGHLPAVAAPRPLLLTHSLGRDLPPVPRTVFDFGHEVTGYLHLTLAPDRVQRAGLLFTGIDAVPDPLDLRPAGAIITIPDRHGWEDASPRRLRYVLVVGLQPAGAEIQPVAEGRAADLAALLPGEERTEGVLGIVPPALRTPVEDEVWRKFERVPGIARREKL